MINGVDVASPYQDGWKPSAGQDFVFVKASQNTGYKNPQRAAKLKLARDAGMVVGHYHWMGAGSLASQLANFKAAADVRAGELIAIDWEEAGVSAASKDSFIRSVKAAFPKNKVGLYCNTSHWLSVDKSGYYGDFLWIAYYSTSQPPISTKWTIWQYSDAGGLDKNRADFASKAAMKAWAAGSASVTQPPAAETADGIPLPSYVKSGAPITWRGGRTCFCVTQAIAVAEAKLIKLGVIKECLDFWQLGYNNGAVKASAGTHDGGGVVDVKQTDAVTQRVLREVGFSASWYRAPGAKYGNMSPVHIHAVLSGCPHVSKGADDQVDDIRAGRNGLGGSLRGPDYGPKVPYITWQNAWKKFVTKASTPSAPVVPVKKEGVPVVAKPVKRSRMKATTFAASSEWKFLSVNEENTFWSIASGPGTIYITVDLKVDVPTRMRFVTVNKKGQKVAYATKYGDIHLVAGGNQLVFYDTIGGPAKGYDDKFVRLQILTGTQKKTVVSKMRIRAGKEA